MAKASRAGAYRAIIERIFSEHFKPGVTEFEFHRREIVVAKELLAPDLDLNPGDIPYSFRYRKALPEVILASQPAGMEIVSRDVV